jgi:hypothetical protein
VISKETAMRTHASVIHREYPGHSVDLKRAINNTWIVLVDGVSRGHIDEDNNLDLRSNPAKEI